MIIDIHTHAFNEKIASAAISLLSQRCGLANTHDGTVTGVINSMRRAGIDISVIQPIATKPGQTEKINNWAAEINKIPGIAAFGSIHPEYEGWKDELSRIRDLGLKGIKFHPDYQDFFVDEGRMVPIYEEAIRLDLAVMFHSGVDIGMPGPVHCTPRRIDNIIGLISGHKFIFAHMGAFEMYGNFEDMIAGRDIYIDTSMALSRMNARQAMEIIRKHGYKKVLFGTDAPWSDQKTEVDFIKEFGLPEDQLNAILAGNAAEILGLELTKATENDGN